jgi:hypothetical protein
MYGSFPIDDDDDDHVTGRRQPPRIECPPEGKITMSSATQLLRQIDAVCSGFADCFALDLKNMYAALASYRKICGGQATVLL